MSNDTEWTPTHIIEDHDGNFEVVMKADNDTFYTQKEWESKSAGYWALHPERDGVWFQGQLPGKLGKIQW